MNWPAFVNPWMLAGLAAAGLPVLIHFLTRARPRRIAFPPFKFLVEACAGRQTVHRLRTILLLTIRCLAVLALVLLFSRPFLKPTGAAANSEAGKRVVIILDASLSMRAVQQGVTLFSRAQSEAADTLRALDSGTEAAVILAGATPRALLPALSRNIPALHGELLRSQPGFENGDAAAALALAGKLLGNNGTICVFSDFQKSNWENVRELPSGVICRLRPVTSQPVENLAIISARVQPDEPIAGEPVEIVCKVFNCSPRPREATVRLELADLTHETRVTLAPFATADAVFNVTFQQPGSFAAKASLQPDDLREDDVRYLAVHVSGGLQVLLISDAELSDRRGAAFYLSRALAPSARATPGLSLVPRRGQDADRGILETAEVFVLAAPAMLSSEAIEIISRRVADGASLMVFLDGPASPTLAAGFSPPFRLQNTVTSETGDTLIPGPRALFADIDANDLNLLRFRRHHRNQVLENRRDDVVLAYADDSAALTASDLGKGTVLFVNFPLTPDAGDFPGNPLFPSMMHELLRAARRSPDDRGVTPGAAWTLDVPARGEGAVSVSDPDGNPVTAQVISSGRTTKLALPAARAPGIYIAKQNAIVATHAAINVDARESDTRPIALENLKSGENSLVTVVRGEAELSLAGKMRPLWPQLAGAAAALLALEMLLLAIWRQPGNTNAKAKAAL